MTSLEPTLSKIPEQRKPPRRQPPSTAACLAEKIVLTFSDLRAPLKNSSKRKGQFFCSAPRDYARAAGAASVLFRSWAKSFLPQPPPLFARSLKTGGGKV